MEFFAFFAAAIALSGIAIFLIVRAARANSAGKSRTEIIYSIQEKRHEALMPQSVCSTGQTMTDYWELTPEQRAEQNVSAFEEMASAIYQAEAAKVSLHALKEHDLVPLLTATQRMRLFTACDKGMTVNPKGCKEWHLFQRFKEWDIPRLFQR